MTAGFDSATPNMARVYDYWLGGKDHYAADRAEADRLLAIYPPLRDLVKENRAFRVAYVDLDPVVLSHARALLATSDGVTAIGADLRDPASVLAHPDLRAVIDPAQRMCVILGAVLHFLNADAARAVTAGYARLMAPGSCLVISVACYDDEVLGKRLAAEYTAAAWHNHSPTDVASFFAGLELVGPGVTEAQAWRAWMPEPMLRHRGGHVLAGVARKSQATTGPAVRGSHGPWPLLATYYSKGSVTASHLIHHCPVSAIMSGRNWELTKM